MWFYSDMTSTQTTQTRPVVATMNIPAGTIHDASYTVAAWYRTFEYDAQTVEVSLSGNFACYKIVGRTTHEHFPSLFGGVATGGGTMGDCDKESTYTVQTHNYNAAELVEAGDMVLTDAATIKESFCDHSDYCRGSQTTYTTDDDGNTTSSHGACDHDSHDNPHGKSLIERCARGFLSSGYVPDSAVTKRHIKIVTV